MEARTLFKASSVPTQVENAADGRRERRRQRGEELILDAATAVFLSKGMSTTTMQDIAQAADVAQGTLYNYFPNKESLTLSVARRMMKSYGRELLETEISRGDLDPLDMVAVSTILLISKGIADPFWRVLVERYDVLSDALYDELHEFALLNLKQAGKQGLLPSSVKSLTIFWRLGAWVIAGAIRDIVQGRMPESDMFAVATHVLMQQGIEEVRAQAIMRRVRARLARDRRAVLPE
jgi:AcrR family transcriptional regulator